jgi:uncharacterized membrane protein
MAGLVLVVPIWVTFIVVIFVFGLMRDASLWLVEAALLSPLGDPLMERWGLQSERFTDHGLEVLPLPFQWGIGAFAILLTISALYLLGTVTTNVVGKRIVALAETILDRVPFVKVIYQASKKVLETLTGEGAQGFQRVVLVPFPNKEMHSVGFITCVNKDERTGETLYTVFVATAPNPTTGYVLVIRPSEVIELDWSIEEAVKVVMSGGVLMPSNMSLQSNSASNMNSNKVGDPEMEGGSAG